MAKTVTLLKESALPQIITDLENAVEVDRILAQQARVGAELAETNSETAQGLSEAARNKSQQWAENNENVEVETGKYSAKHYSLKAAQSAAGIADSAEMLIKHEAEINALENTLNSANINQETTATVTGVDTVSLPKTAANTGMQVQLFGQSAQNLVVNGDFRNGTTGWTSNSSLSVVNEKLRTTTLLAGDILRVSRAINQINTGSKVYIKIKDFQQSVAGSQTPYVSIRTSADSFIAFALTLANTTDIQTASSITTTTGNIGIVQVQGYNGLISGAYHEFSSIMAINLTAIGLDSLTKEQCDILFANYFEGSDNVLGTGRIRSVNSAGLLPSYLYFNGGQLRSNGLIKDEIRKGANGYELVKRVGVGTLGANGITGGDFEGGLVGIVNDGSGSVSTWSINTSSPISGTQDGRLIVTTAPASLGRPVYNINVARTQGQYRRLSFDFKVNSGSPVISGFLSGNVGEVTILNRALVGAGKFEYYYTCNGTQPFGLYFAKSGVYDIQLDNFKDELINTPDGAATGNTVTVIGSNIHYTLATPIITPIAHAGLLNSNSNGTAYFEPIIADAGVYSTNLAVQLTDYPIASFESIRKYANGTYTELNTVTAVIASGGLSFTHPNLVSGDLVMFTYAYNKESIGRSMTLTHYDSRFVEADTANGKVYRIVPVVTNGVVSWTTVEV